MNDGALVNYYLNVTNNSNNNMQATKMAQITVLR